MPAVPFTQYEQYDIDFLIMLNILALFLLAALCFASGKKHRRILPLRLLGIASLSGSIAWGVDLWIYNLASASLQLLLHDIVFSIPHFFLIEFWVQARILAGRCGQRLRVYSGVALVSLASLVVFFVAGIHLFRVLSPFFGYIFLTLTFWELSRPLTGKAKKNMLFLFVSSLFIFGAALPLLFNRFANFFATTPLTKATAAFYHDLFSTEIFSLALILLIHCIAFLIFSLGIWFFYLSFFASTYQKRLNRSLGVLVLLFFVLFIGFTNIERAEEAIEDSMEKALIEKTQLLATSIHNEYIDDLRGQETDRQREQYQHIRTILNQLVKNHNNIKSISISSFQAGEIRYLVNCRGNQELPIGSKVSQEEYVDLLKVFTMKIPVFFWGPFPAADGTAVRCSVPILYDKENDLVRAVFTAEFSRPNWIQAIDSTRRIPLQTTMAIGIAVIILFITVYKQKQMNIRRVISIQKYQTLFESVHEGLMYVRVIFSDQGTPTDIICLEMNPSAEKLLDISPAETLNKSIRDVFYKNNMEKAMYWIVYFGEVAQTQRARAADIQFAHNKKYFEVQAISWQKGYCVLLFTDITERREMEKQHRRLALHDHLTDLPNRRLFADRLEQAMVRTNRSRISCAVLYMDLDKFKPVNDEYGHNWGDVVLKEAAGRLLECIRKSDTLARIGGDEFVIVQQEVEHVDQVRIVAEKIQKAFSSPFAVDGIDIQLGISIGVSIYPDHASGVTQLVARADMAMYEAKQNKSVPFILAKKS